MLIDTVSVSVFICLWTNFKEPSFAENNMDKIPEHRTQNFKAKTAFKPKGLRRARNEANVELRKQKREENLSKRRNLAIAAESEDSEDETVTAAANLVLMTQQ